jgi:hypothetical protein
MIGPSAKKSPLTDSNEYNKYIKILTYGLGMITENLYEKSQTKKIMKKMEEQVKTTNKI